MAHRRRGVTRAALAAVLAAVLAPVFATGGAFAPAVAADRKEMVAIPLPPQPAPQLRDVAPPAYQARLDRLAELMGTLSYLRDLCGDGDGAQWRDRMQTLLAAEGTSPDRRDRLAGSFNRGFADYRLTYRSCTPAAGLVIARALTEGAKLAAAVSTQFGTP